MRILLTGWFSFDHAEVTGGDLLAQQTVRRWLSEVSMPHDVAVAANFRSPGDVDWTTVDPDAVTHLIFACGPAGGVPVEQLFERFPLAKRILLGASVVATTSVLSPDVVIERDSSLRRAPDLALGTSTERVPVVAVVLSHAQPEYGDRQAHDDAHRRIDALMVASDVAPVSLDTRLHPREGHLCATPDQLESALARFDAVVTTRLHGLVLGLKVGVPVLALDPIRGGAKVLRQAEALRWPAAVSLDDAGGDRLADWLSWCLTTEASDRAASCAARSSAELATTRDLLLDAIGVTGSIT